ncbi:MAG: zinc-ribbon domain-containing protein [Ruminococcaceae bacterium]|nr:zinc-ribbon domain-containing protein [Oscillospiraceae bacterium]
MNCNVCGAKISETTKFCKNCGSKVVKKSERSNGLYCKKCGKSLKENAVFCGGCGEKVIKEQEVEKIVENTEVKAPVAAPSATPTITPKKPKKKNNGLIVTLIVILCLVVGICAGLVVYSLMNNNDDSSDDDTSTSQSDTNDDKSKEDEENKEENGETNPDDEDEKSDDETPKKVESTYSCYKEDLTWREANDLAKDEGGYIVSINSKKEFDLVCDIADDEGIKVFWLGSKIRLGDSWDDAKWSDGTKIKYTKWFKTDDVEEPTYYSEEGEPETYLMAFKVGEDWYFNDAENDVSNYYAGRIGCIIEKEEEIEE